MNVTCTVDRHASFNKLFKLLIDKGIKKKDLCEIAGVSPTSIAKLVHGGNVSTDMLCKICCALDCDIGDIMEFVISFRSILISEELTILWNLLQQETRLKPVR